MYYFVWFSNQHSSEVLSFYLLVVWFSMGKLIVLLKVLKQDLCDQSHVLLFSYILIVKLVIQQQVYEAHQCFYAEKNNTTWRRVEIGAFFFFFKLNLN